MVDCRHATSLSIRLPLCDFFERSIAASRLLREFAAVSGRLFAAAVARPLLSDNKQYFVSTSKINDNETIDITKGTRRQNQQGKAQWQPNKRKQEEQRLTRGHVTKQEIKQSIETILNIYRRMSGLRAACSGEVTAVFARCTERGGEGGGGGGGRGGGRRWREYRFPLPLRDVCE